MQQTDIEKISREYRERLESDEEYKKTEEKRRRKTIEKCLSILEKQAKRGKRKQQKAKTAED